MLKCFFSILDDYRLVPELFHHLPSDLLIDDIVFRNQDSLYALGG